MIQKPKSAEINPGPGFRIRKDIKRLPQDILSNFKEIDTADISDMLNRMYTMSAEIHNQVNNTKLVGIACTAKVYPGDNLMVHKALDIARPGDIIVVDTGGNRRNAVMGDLIANKAKSRGIAGFVIDGLVRDIHGIIETGMPVYARGITPIGPLHRGPGELNYAISCGGIVVFAGDIIVADADGVVVVRKDFAADILKRLLEHKESMAQYVADVKRGQFSNDWVDAQLRQDNCDINE